MSFFSRFVSLVMSVLMSFLPFVGFEPKKDDILLNVGIISDTHIDYRWLPGKQMLANGLSDMGRSDANLDAVVISGDLTTYGDGKSMEDFYKILGEYNRADKMVVASGNHDIGHVEDITHQQARDNMVRLYNEYTGEQTENIYYSIDVKGYTFIVISDQSDDSWDFPEFYDDQLTFLDTELTRATASGKPAFVVCHWPVPGVNGQPTVWDDGAIRPEYGDKIIAILEKYRNVFYISGHMHLGVTVKLIEKTFDFSSVETINGVNYVNLPSFGLVNRYGVPWGGLGFQMEVYADEVIFRTRNYATGRWYNSLVFSTDLV